MMVVDPFPKTLILLEKESYIKNISHACVFHRSKKSLYHHNNKCQLTQLFVMCQKTNYPLHSYTNIRITHFLNIKLLENISSFFYVSLY